MNKEQKNTILLLLVTLFIGVLFFGYKEAFRGRFFGVKVFDEGRLNEKIGTLSEITPDMNKLLVNGNPVAYDAIDNRIFISQDLEKENWKGILSCTEGSLLFLKDQYMRDKNESIASGIEHTLVWIGEDTFFETKVVVTGMPVMTLDTWEEVGREAWAGAMKLYDPSQTGNEYQTGVCNYSVRGNIARLYDKKSYKLTLSDEKMPLCGLREDDDWTLNALYDDVGLIRNKLCYQVWNEMSASNGVDGDNTVETAFVELLVNDEYKGVYLLCDRIDAKKLSLSEGDLLYKQKTWDGKRDHLKEAFIVSYPKVDEEDMYRYKDPMEELMDCVYYPDENNLTYDKLENKLYFENAIDYYLFTLYTCAGDNRFENSYFIAKDTADGYKFSEIPWDMNATFGNVRVKYYPERIQEIAGGTSKVAEALMYCDNKAFMVEAADRWFELRENVLSDVNINDLANQYISYTEKSGAYDRNLKKWPLYQVNGGHSKYYFSELWNKEDLFGYIENRGAYLDKYFEQ